MTDEELLEAAASKMWDAAAMRGGPSFAERRQYEAMARAALEVFRREQGPRDEALREALRLVSQARSRLFDQDRCEHPDCPELAALEAESPGCEHCNDLLWGHRAVGATIEPADNLNSSLYAAEHALRRALSERSDG